MEKADYPVTPAIRLLREKRIPFEPHLYDYKERGGTAHSAAELRVPEHAVIKTLVMETDKREPLIILMHGDLEVSTKRLARILGVKTILVCDPAVAQKHTGYLVGARARSARAERSRSMSSARYSSSPGCLSMAASGASWCRSSRRRCEHSCR